MSDERVRWFLAIPVEPALAERVAAALEPARVAAPRARFSSPADYHLTVRFFGDVPEPLRDPLIAAVAERTPRIAPFVVELQRAGTFGRPPRVLWIGPDHDDQPFQALARAVEEAAASVGLPPRDLDPRAHLTVARSRGPGDRDLRRAAHTVGPLVLPAVWADHLALFDSPLPPRGAQRVLAAPDAHPGSRYRVLRELPLGSEMPRAK